MNRTLHITTRHNRLAAAVGVRVAVPACESIDKQRFMGASSGNRMFVGPVEEGSSLP